MHFGFITVPFRSHFTALAALAQALRTRGHAVTFFHQRDAASYLTASPLTFEAVGHASHPAGTLARTVERAANPRGPLGFNAVIRDMARTTDMLCRELPAALTDRRVDALIVDQMEAAGGLVAQALGLPFISVACALPINRQPNLPLPVMPFAFKDTPMAARMYSESTRVYDWMMRPLGRVIEAHARRLGLPPRQRLDQCLSPLAQISQTTERFDFPRDASAALLHHVGPLRDEAAMSSAPAGQSPRRRSRARPLVFASLGTLQGHRLPLFEKIARACARLPADLLLAHCDRLRRDDVQKLKAIGATTVVSFADQAQALADADAVVTHAGLNTVLDAIAARTPILALPIAFDQAGVAARVTHAQVGYWASPSRSNAASLAGQLTRLLADDAVRQGLDRQAQGIAVAGGAARAADLVLAALAIGTPSEPAGDHHG